MIYEKETYAPGDGLCAGGADTGAGYGAYGAGGFRHLHDSCTLISAAPQALSDLALVQLRGGGVCDADGGAGAGDNFHG